MVILAIDPQKNILGYALLDGNALIVYGYLERNVNDNAYYVTKSITTGHQYVDLPSKYIQGTLRFDKLLRVLHVKKVIIEYPRFGINRNALVVCNFAAGMVYQQCIMQVGSRNVYYIEPNIWRCLEGVKKDKESYWSVVFSEFPEVAPLLEEGTKVQAGKWEHAIDAIAMGLCYYKNPLVFEEKAGLMP